MTYLQSDRCLLGLEGVALQNVSIGEIEEPACFLYLLPALTPFRTPVPKDPKLSWE